MLSMILELRCQRTSVYSKQLFHGLTSRLLEFSLCMKFVVSNIVLIIDSCNHINICMAFNKNLAI